MWILGVCIFILFLCIITSILYINQIIIPKTDLDVYFEVEKTNRQDCGKNINYCFDDSDCRTTCINDGVFSCIVGICTENTIIEQQVLNDCDPNKGIVSFLVGDTQRGVYENICKSIDPGVANNDGTNNMCLGGIIDINYNLKFPAIGDCNCTDKNIEILPATQNVRPIAKCVNDDMANYFNL